MLFVVSLFINALGVAFITKALLGTSPITSVNYVLSMFTPLTMGQWTILLNLSFVLLDLLFMTRRELRRERTSYLLQIPISLSFGLFIDFAMVMLFWLPPASARLRLYEAGLRPYAGAAGVPPLLSVHVRHPRRARGYGRRGAGRGAHRPLPDTPLRTPRWLDGAETARIACG